MHSIFECPIKEATEFEADLIGYGGQASLPEKPQDERVWVSRFSSGEIFETLSEDDEKKVKAEEMGRTDNSFDPFLSCPIETSGDPSLSPPCWNEEFPPTEDVNKWRAEMIVKELHRQHGLYARIPMWICMEYPAIIKRVFNKDYKAFRRGLGERVRIPLTDIY